jgi:hypothetical protein
MNMYRSNTVQKKPTPPKIPNRAAAANFAAHALLSSAAYPVAPVLAVVVAGVVPVAPATFTVDRYVESTTPLLSGTYITVTIFPPVVVVVNGTLYVTVTPWGLVEMIVPQLLEHGIPTMILGVGELGVLGVRVDDKHAVP